MVLINDAALRPLRLTLIAAAHKRALQRQLQRQCKDISSMTTTHPFELTPTMFSILHLGMRYETFSLTRQQAGKASGFLKLHGYIDAAPKKGEYTLTPKGREEYERTKALREAITPDAVPEVDEGINRADPALRSASGVETDHIGAVAAQRQVRINHLEKTIDDLNKLLDQRGDRIKHLEWQFDMRGELLDQSSSQIEAQRRLIADLNDQIAHLERSAQKVDSVMAVAILDELCEMLPEIEAYRTSRETAVKAINTLKARR
jgi:DNA-binding PadR family transcriptional regulator